jgi:hypothetical protein
VPAPATGMSSCSFSWRGQWLQITLGWVLSSLLVASVSVPVRK